MSRLLSLIGAAAARHPWRVVTAWLFAAALVAGLAGAFGGAFQDTFDIPGSETQRTNDLLEERFPAMSGTSARVVLHDENGVEPAVVDHTAAELAELDHVSSVSPAAIGAEGVTALLTVQYDVPMTSFEGSEGLEALEGATEGAVEDGYQVEYGGPVPENSQEVSGRAEMVGVGVALLILLVAFGALMVAALPLVVALMGLLTGIGGITLLAALTDVSTNAPTLATMVGLGIGIDYALFIVTRHRDGLAQGLSVADAAGQANATAGQSVVFAGGTVLLALAGLRFSGLPDFATMGYATGLIVLVMMLAAVTLLPALLGLLKHRVYSRRDRRAGRLESRMSHSHRRSVRPHGRSQARAMARGVDRRTHRPGPACGRHADRSERRGQRGGDHDRPRCIRPGGRGVRARCQRAAAGRCRPPDPRWAGAAGRPRGGPRGHAERRRGEHAGGLARRLGSGADGDARDRSAGP